MWLLLPPILLLSLWFYRFFSYFMLGLCEVVGWFYIAPMWMYPPTPTSHVPFLRQLPNVFFHPGSLLLSLIH